MKDLTDKELKIALDVVDSYLDSEIEFCYVYEREDVNKATEDLDLKAIHDETYRIMQEVRRLFYREFYR